MEPITPQIVQVEEEHAEDFSLDQDLITDHGLSQLVQGTLEDCKVFSYDEVRVLVIRALEKVKSVEEVKDFAFIEHLFFLQ